MIRVLIRYNNKEIEIIKDSSIAMNRSVAPFLKFDTNRNIVSFTWDIPYNDEVAAFFGFVGTAPFSDVIVGEKLQTTIEHNGTTINGITEIKSYKKNNLQALFISGNRIWWSYLEDLNLCDLDFNQVYNWDAAHVKDNFSNGSIFTDFTNGYSNQFTPYPIYWSLKGFGKWDDDALGVQLKDMRPDFWAKALIEKIFEQVPVTLNSNFFESDFFDNILCYMQDAAKGTHTEQYAYDNFDAEASANITQEDIYEFPLPPLPNTSNGQGIVRYENEIYDGGNNFTTGSGYADGLGEYSYQAPATGTYEIDFNFEFTDLTSYPNGVNDFYIMLIKYTDNGFSITIEEEIAMNLEFNIQVNDVISTNIDIELNEGEYFWFRMFYDVNSPRGSSGDTFTYNSQLKITAKDINYAPGHPFEVKRILPCTPVIDFLKGLTHAFNLQFLYNTQTNVLVVEPYKDAYKGLSDYDDWSEIFDTSSLELEFIITELTDQQKFNWQSDGIADEDLHSYTHKLENKYSTKKITEYKNPYFAATENYLDNTLIGKTIIPKMWGSEKNDFGEQPEQDFDFKPRLFYFKGYGTYVGEKWKFDNSASYSEKIPKAMQVGEPPKFANNQDLDFETLFELFYLKNFNDIESGSILKGDFLIDLNLFKNTDFRKPKLIKYKGMNVYLRLLKIKEFKLGGDVKTSCELIYWKG
jgi:hypothetical protein